jgi:preprotein translocase subunit SecG
VYLFVVVLHILLCLLLVMIVLLQPGKGGDVGAAFGGGSSMFGPRGPTTALSRATTGVAVLFMVTSITLALMSGGLAGNADLDSLLRDSDEGGSVDLTPTPAPAPDVGVGAPPATGP